jgi:hypothetical protein
MEKNKLLCFQKNTKNLRKCKCNNYKLTKAKEYLQGKCQDWVLRFEKLQTAPFLSFHDVRKECEKKFMCEFGYEKTIVQKSCEFFFSTYK